MGPKSSVFDVPFKGAGKALRKVGGCRLTESYLSCVTEGSDHAILRKVSCANTGFAELEGGYECLSYRFCVTNERIKVILS